jgi:hypothetical protein
MDEEKKTPPAEVAAWTAGLSALFIMGGLGTAPGWPMAAGAAAVAAMVAVVCYLILRRP